MSKKKCSESWQENWHKHFCQLAATVFEDGKDWCKKHAPSHREAKRKEREADWKAKQNAQDARYAIQQAERAVVLAAEAYVAQARIVEMNANLCDIDNGQLIEAVRLLECAKAVGKELGVVLM